MADFTRSSAALGDEAAIYATNTISWGAIFAGVVVALVVQVLLTMLGAGIGVATIDPATGDSPTASTFSITAGIWYAVSGIIAAYAGGYIAARVSGRAGPMIGALHGLTTWAFTTLLVLYLLTTAVGSIVGGAFSGLTNALGGVGQTIAQTAGPSIAESNPLDVIERQVTQTGDDPEALKATAVAAIRAVVTGDQASANEARQRAAEALAAARDIPVDQAAQQVAQIEQEYRQAVAQTQQAAAEGADAAADALSTSALVAFVALALGAIAAWFGGRAGVLYPADVSRVGSTRRTQ